MPQPSVNDGPVDSFAAAPQPTMPSSPAPYQAQPNPETVPQPAMSTVPPAKDQTDDLDKEWIAKAKMIVEQTKNDPYLQSKEIGKVKADYLRIRFNKHIKVSPDQKV
ncbi:MAG TPA: hypothetical protein VFB59_00240 [Candidatus Saccharimonadales bacterium]|nr:hypothetical protein [Candidatus Saccharimonadales bacterium]